MLKKFFRNLLIIGVILPLCLSCQKKEASVSVRQPSAKANVNDRLTIGFSIDTLAIERWQRDMDVFINKAKEMGADVIVQNAGNSIEEQNRQLMYLLERNVDAVVVLPKDAASITESVQKLRAKGIPVISSNRKAHRALRFERKNGGADMETPGTGSAFARRRNGASPF